VSAFLEAGLSLIVAQGDEKSKAIAKAALAKLRETTKGTVVCVVVGRCVTKEKTAPWSELPDGKMVDLYAAIERIEIFKKVMRDPANAAQLPKEWRAFAQDTLELYRSTNTKMEVRVLKRTQTDEVVEETVRVI
jgi:hypothetical protein